MHNACWETLVAANASRMQTVASEAIMHVFSVLQQNVILSMRKNTLAYWFALFPCS